MLNITFKQLDSLIRADIKSNIAPILLGEPGIGKSSYLENLAREFKTKVFTLPMNQLADRADLTGARVVETTDSYDSSKTVFKQEFFPHATIMDSISYANAHPDECPILFLDEANRTEDGITSAALSFITLRRVGTMDFPKNLRFVLAGNDKGNITVFDKASITRFSVYKITPDAETFLEKNTNLNPFVSEVIRKNPKLITPDEIMSVQTVGSSDPDDDDEAATMFDINAFGDESAAFDQMTVPRTITSVSNWLNSLGENGIKKSGTDEELKLIQDLKSETISQDNASQSLLLYGIIAHSGNSEFSHDLNELIEDYFTSTISSTATATTQGLILERFRPEQDVINTMSRAKDVPEVETLIATLDAEQQERLFVWLFEEASVFEINNNVAVTAALNYVLNSIQTLSRDVTQGVSEIVSHHESVSRVTLNAMAASNTPIANSLNGLLRMSGLI